MEIADIPLRNPKGRVAGKIIVVAGAGSPADGWSNGSAAAALLGREGATIFCIDKDPAALERIAEVLTQLGVTHSTSVADITKLEEVEQSINACHDIFGRIDALYNNVGAGSFGTGYGGVVETTEENWRATLDINLTSAYYTSKCVLPIMRRQQSGSLVHLSSVSAIAYLRNTLAAYSAAKAGLLQLSNTIAMQHVTQGIRSNCVIAGSIDTGEIRRRIVASYGADRLEEVIQLRDEVLPTGRSGTPWDIANAVLYLASDESGYVTGTEILVDGGFAHPQCGSFRANVPEKSAAIASRTPR